MCETGFHFCRKLIDCFDYYIFDPERKVAEIKAYGKVLEEGNKCCTGKIKIVRELSWNEVLDLINVGRGNKGLGNTGSFNSGGKNAGESNAGDYNTGDYNAGDHNSGDGNSGYRNSGNSNAGSWNSGNSNIGNCNVGKLNAGIRNAGSFNIGSWNAGNYNRGYYNAGEWNSGDWNAGCFCEKMNKMLFFDQPSDWNFVDWRVSEAREIMNSAPAVIEEIMCGSMSEEEKERNPEAETTGGYLKRYNREEMRARTQMWWDELGEREKAEIRALPNFDSEKFGRIMWGIVV